ncbi:MAM domain-containing glycosylphosphatidylinositol anchor protein 1-like [Lingula anatina]|nr:MAM domain-containing glycosylphosphatidylinositol anchor protein 1-like [Lingula anatina]|eukprot:XP_013412138.1 MAM domain-containing glycosylphosphatidylinositol anchor protein 1-like [Lingula anatina]
MYLEASGYYNLKARIISPYITATNGEYCVDFYYHMYGDYMGTMNIGVRYDYNTYPVWQKWGDQGNMWRRMRLTARVSGYGTYNLYIEGEVGRSHTSDMAIDNLVVYQGAC